MKIPAYFVPLNNTRPKPVQKASVSFDKSHTNNDSAKQEGVLVAKVNEKRKGEDRRKRNIKPLIDTRSGRDRRYDRARPSVDIKA